MNNSHIQFSWLGSQPPTSTAGITWGVPWDKGVLDRNEALALFDDNDSPVPLQTWNLAYWPDGSVKWTAHATVAGENSPDSTWRSATRILAVVKPEWPMKRTPSW